MPPEWVDLWLMERFPGKTFEELDRIDWFRLLRVWEVEQIAKLAGKHERFISGKIQPESISTEDWNAIKELSSGDRTD